MQLTFQHRRKITLWYCIMFYLLMLFKWWNGMFLYQVKPQLFNNRFDMFTWIFMKTGLHQWLLNNPKGWLSFDVAFYIMPLLVWLAFMKSVRLSAIVSLIMLLVNWVYIQCYTLYPTISIEGFIAWLLFPVLFITINLQSFYFILNGLRYFFLYFFASASVWKLIQKGVFNIHQMSGVLLYQHKEYLTSSSNWYTHFIYWLINHPSVSYLFYIGGSILELSFIVGFFTKKYDLLLIAAFLLFLVMDVLLMRIHYWEVAAFLLTLIYSKYSMPSYSRSQALKR
jgi:hypothetical protein